MTVGELRKALEGVKDKKKVLFVDKDFFSDECGSIDVNYDGEAVVIWSASLEYEKTRSEEESPK